ncbi:ATP-dependent DNA helicase RecG [hydrothermal vent metagenome]|uniref:ATP-dependent DNA helicase RecG n=1 Tax=hydrothermal vent metagenome TaxID=652676 RepID=A0A3B1DC16_9ZZZZ
MSFSFPWQTDVQYLKGIGPKRAFLLKKLHIHTLEDLLYFVPFRYEDRAELKQIAHLTAGKTETVEGEVMAVSLSETPRRRMKIVDVAISDASGLLHAKWFNQHYLKNYFKKGDRVMFSGLVKENYFGGRTIEMENPRYERVEADEALHMDRIVPVYHETKGFTSKQIRSVLKQVLARYAGQIPEILPLLLRERYRFLPLFEAIQQIHFPEKETDIILLNQGRSPAHRRLIFDELFILQTGLALRKKGMSEKVSGIAFKVNGPSPLSLKKLLPFSLTAAQKRVFSEIRADMSKPFVMNRLIQGDVGCGKTLVALMSILVAIDNARQTALMAPTEILAVQHYLSLKVYLHALGKSVFLLTSDMRKKEKDEVLSAVASGNCDLLIGTHALIQKAVVFKNLGLVVVDEQHKFGVLQRVTLLKKGRQPELLILTATPIPRTLALTLYGDLSLSVIDELPPGRSPIHTHLHYGNKREGVYRFIATEIQKGRQAFVVCPLVDISEKLDLKAAMERFEYFKRDVFPDLNIALLHGKMKRDEKEKVMAAFKEGKINLLVATTVVEVGIDIPNATVMAIEHAERFGLSQLHQLRGRVGRGSEQSYCLMIADYPISKEGKRRLKAMVQTTDGFKIAEEDLSIRGPGEFFGTKQSGLPSLHVANLIRDVKILEVARKEAFDWVETHPMLEDVESRPIRDFLERKWRGKLEWLSIA